ncbi:DUF551 domain-containing protein [Enterobacter kobei]|uniref:DUF551 domain-containing protein n=1 Tax=Enterobacter kobei TaxID=208224 RepID=UPI0020750E0D|nr:DUF551 domain-containing protein [Enterobacter kobei]MCM7149894.1 DUF551 domain-containing protein [Enterobacter kobei]
MITFTKEQLIASAHARIEFAEMMLAGELEPLKERTWSIELELARIVLASLEAKSRKLFTCSGCGAEGLDEPLESKCHCNEDGALWVEGIVYTAPPAPVSVPDAMEMDDDFDSAFEHGKAVGWNACRAAMLQGADRPQNEPQNIPENIPATQFKPVADLYGLTSPTGGETSFTFDAVEARDFIDGGWLCQEYVTLERYQETLFQGAEPVSLRDGIAAIRNLGPIDAEKIQAERDALNSPVITDGWVACSERMPEKGRILALFGKRTKENCDPYVDEGYLGSDGEFYFFDWESGPRIDDCHPYDKAIVSHWMYWELPAAPQQEVK